jgi:DNA-directed RNA polymerase II subunit RPB3
MDYCQLCSIILTLNVACHESRTMDITSDHLEVSQNFGGDDGANYGVEPPQRVAQFGWPVGKGGSIF